jgi:hypothetical protein
MDIIGYFRIENNDSNQVNFILALDARFIMSDDIRDSPVRTMPAHCGKGSSSGQIS